MDKKHLTESSIYPDLMKPLGLKSHPSQYYSNIVSFDVKSTLTQLPSENIK